MLELYEGELFAERCRREINGVHAVDTLDGKEYQIKSKVVVNATGVFVDDVMKMDECDTRRKVRPSQGVHLVVDSKFLGGRSALMIPKTKDGRVLLECLGTARWYLAPRILL